jgi:hypothetical protein
VESVIKRLPNSLEFPNSFLQGRIHGRTCGYKWSLLKGRYKREHDGAQVALGGRESFPSSGAFKTYADLWKGGTSDSHLIINERGGAWVASQPGEGGP